MRRPQLAAILIGTIVTAVGSAYASALRTPAPPDPPPLPPAAAFDAEHSAGRELPPPEGRSEPEAEQTPPEADSDPTPAPHPAVNLPPDPYRAPLRQPSPPLPTELTPPEPDPMIPGDLFYRIPAQERNVVLTIDDGPGPYTEAILEVLRRERVPAVFFWLGGNRYGIHHAATAVADGHMVANHSMTHPRLPELGADGQQREIGEAQRILSEVSGRPVQYFRPPYGAYNAETIRIAREAGMQVALWSVDSRDWALESDPPQIIRNVMAGVHPGAIILLHERKQTLAVLPELIQSLRREGYRFVLLPGGEPEPIGPLPIGVSMSPA